MRAFVSINIPLDISRLIERWAKLADFQYLYKTMRWLPEDSYHVTLRFLGDVPETQLVTYWEKVKPVLETQNSFDVVIRSFLFLPDVNAAKIVAAKVDADPALSGMAEMLESNARRCGFTAEHKSFRPHISIARFKRPAQIPPLNPVDPLHIVHRVSEVILMQSHLDDRGAKYTLLDNASLMSAVP